MSAGFALIEFGKVALSGGPGARLAEMTVRLRRLVCAGLGGTKGT